MADHQLTRLQRAWNSVQSLPPIDFTETEAQALFEALYPKHPSWRQPSIEERPY